MSAARREAERIAKLMDKARLPGPARMDDRLRLLRYVDQGAADECWPWGGVVSVGGYGRTHFYSNGVRKSCNAHRVAWMVARGSIPPKMHVLHRCDNRACCNPAHLFLGTNVENTADRHAKGRDARGARNAKTKFTPEQVAEIRRQYAAGRSAYSIAKEYGVWDTSICRIVQGKNHRILATGGPR